MSEFDRLIRSPEDQNDMLSVAGSDTTPYVDAQVADEVVSSATFDAFGHASKMRMLYHYVKRHDAEIRQLENRTKDLEERCDVFDGKAFSWEKCLEIQSKAIKDLETSMMALDSDVKKSEEILEAINAESALKAEILRLHFNQDCKRYYTTLITELESAYVAAMVMKTGGFEKKQVRKYESAVGYLKFVIQLVPVAGTIANTLIDKGMEKINYVATRESHAKLMRVADIASTTTEFDRIAVRLSIALTLKNEEYLRNLKEAPLPSSWYTNISLKSPINSVLEWYMKDIQTVAEHRAKTDALRIISFLEKEAVVLNEKFSTSASKEDDITAAITQQMGDSQDGANAPRGRAAWCSVM
eukprot:TRINITY_DN18648_c0_g1_i1.p1 TRINITY_DN18648_c0_g1~~TRINITY_DN18648_c0_g1_i1.p1  ORF type:complete len:368 (+),score=105.12 TRINITY_DN18648_c0_g1_i1:37-1104(+)